MLPSAPSMDDLDMLPPVDDLDTLSKEWTCHVCTLLNPMTTTTCQVCGAATECVDALELATSSAEKSEKYPNNQGAAQYAAAKAAAGEERHRLTPALLRLHHFHQMASAKSKFSVRSAAKWIVDDDGYFSSSCDFMSALSLLQELVGCDFMHISGKGRNKYDLRLSDTQLRKQDVISFGRRFGRETKGDNVRRQAREKAEEEEESSSSTMTTAPDSIGFFTRIGRHVGAAPGSRSVAQHLREALSEAILRGATDGVGDQRHEVNHTSRPLPLHVADFQAIDRTSRPSFVDEERVGMVPGLRSVYAPSVCKRIRSIFGKIFIYFSLLNPKHCSSSLKR